MSTGAKIATLTTVLLLVFGSAFFAVWFYFPYSEGWESGTLNYFKREGFVFKTYEGKVIQEGIKGKMLGQWSSNEFKFSVTDPALADTINHLAGEKVDLHYKQYLHALWWRGDSEYVVDSIR